MYFSLREDISAFNSNRKSKEHHCEITYISYTSIKKALLRGIIGLLGVLFGWLIGFVLFCFIKTTMFETQMKGQFLCIHNAAYMLYLYSALRILFI